MYQQRPFRCTNSDPCEEGNDRMWRESSHIKTSFAHTGIVSMCNTESLGGTPWSGSDSFRSLNVSTGGRLVVRDSTERKEWGSGSHVLHVSLERILRMKVKFISWLGHCSSVRRRNSVSPQEMGWAKWVSLRRWLLLVFVLLCGGPEEAGMA